MALSCANLASTVASMFTVGSTDIAIGGGAAVQARLLDINTTKVAMNNFRVNPSMPVL